MRYPSKIPMTYGGYLIQGASYIYSINAFLIWVTSGSTGAPGREPIALKCMAYTVAALAMIDAPMRAMLAATPAIGLLKKADKHFLRLS